MTEDDVEVVGVLMCPLLCAAVIFSELPSRETVKGCNNFEDSIFHKYCRNQFWEYLPKNLIKYNVHKGCTEQFCSLYCILYTLLFTKY